jgi:hypothetical protein
MLKSKLLVPVALCAVVALASANAYGPQDGNDTNAASAAASAVQNAAGAETGVVIAGKVQQRSPRFENLAFNATPENRWLHEVLSKPVPPLDFPGENPLSEILDTLSAYYTTKFGAGAGPDGGDFRMTFYPDVAELELEGITSLKDVAVNNINFEGIKLRHALKLIFAQTTDPELTYMIENQVMKVTTVGKAESESNYCTRVYNVGELADLKFRTGQVSRPRIPNVVDEAPVKGGGVGYFSVPSQSSTGKTAPAAKADQEETVSNSDLRSLIIEMTTPPAKWFSRDGEGGSIQLVGHVLFVRQTPSVRQNVVALLNMLDMDSAYETRVYKVGELADLRISADQVSSPQNPRPRSFDSSGLAAGTSKQMPVANSNLESLIIEMTARHWSPTDGEGGAIRRVGQNLVIRQTAAVHSQIMHLLELLSKLDTPRNGGH